MPDIFISYKRENKSFAETLRENLLAWGYSVWMDVYDIPPGAHWPDAIDAGITGAHTVIGLLSPLAVQSRNVKNEWDWAIVNERRLLLIMLEDCTVPVNYVSINYIDATADPAAAFERLRGALAHPVDPPAARHDPHLPYLQQFYDWINRALAQKIIKIDVHKEPQPIELISRRTDNAVDVLFEKRDGINPFFTAMGIEDELEPQFEAGDFHAAFEHYDGRVLLLGEPGAGKTITLLHFGRDAVVQRIQNPAAPLPFLVLIPTWDASAQTPLMDWIAESYNAPPDTRQVIEAGRALLLLDGLDELGGEQEDPDTKERYDPRERFIAALAELPENPVVVTCRVADYKAIGTRIALNGAVTLQALSDAQMQHYLDELPDLWAALQADDQLREIARTPLLLSFLAFVYSDMTQDDTKSLRDLANSSGDLRDAIFERYIRERYRHEELRLKVRKDKLPFSLEEINDVLGEAAMRNIDRNWALTYGNWFDLIGSTTREFIDLAVKLNLLIKREQAGSRAGEWDTHAVLDVAEHGFRFEYIHLILRDFFVFQFATANLHDETRYYDSTVRQETISYSPADALRRLGDKRAVPLLINALTHESPLVRRQIVDTLDKIGDESCVAPIAALLDDVDSRVRYGAVEFLGKFGTPDVVDPLVAKLSDENQHVRRAVAKVLGDLGHSRAAVGLISALQDEQAHVRSMAALSLGVLGSEIAVAGLSESLNDTEVLPRWAIWGRRVCDVAADALTQIGTPEALAAIEAWRASQ